MLIDDLAEPANEKDINRREFLASLGFGSLGVAGVGTAVTGVSFLSPSVLYEPPRKVQVGTIGDFPEGTVQFFPEYKLYVVRLDRQIHSLRAICTHLGCMTRYSPGQAEVLCPCHGSRFDLMGKVLQGPATRSLPHYPMERRGVQLVVDRGHEADSGEVLTL